MILFEAAKQANLGRCRYYCRGFGLSDGECAKTGAEIPGYPGMKVLQFAFDSREESDYLPHNYEKNCVVYTGTHDNNTVLGWLDEMSPKDRAFAQKYMNYAESKAEKRFAMGFYSACNGICSRIWR